MRDTSLEQMRNVMKEDSEIIKILLYEIRDVKKDVKILTETVTTLKVKMGLASGIFGVMGGIAVQALHFLMKLKGS